MANAPYCKSGIRGFESTAALQLQTDLKTARGEGGMTTVPAAGVDGVAPNASLAVLPCLLVPVGSITPYVLTVGDPDRAVSIGQRLDDGHELGRYREYVTWQGQWKAVPVTVTSHGVGGAGAAVAFEELALGGARTIIRLGTAGSALHHIRSGDLLIATGAIREDGVSDQLLPPSYPAIADHAVTQALIEAATDHPAVRFGTGVLMTKAAFYPGALPDQREVWSKTPLVGFEMELAALLIVAALRSLRAGGVFTVDGNPAEGDPEDARVYNPHRDVVREGKERMIEVGLGAITRLAALDAATAPEEEPS
jgi:uridine phosphorylase